MMHPSTDLAGHIVTGLACRNDGAAGIPSIITAAGTGDATKETGRTIDRMQSGAMADSLVVVTLFAASLDTAETLTLAHELQESADNSTWDTAEVVQAATVVATGLDADAEGQSVQVIDLRARKRYIRVNVTPNLSRAGTDIAVMMTAFILAGFEQSPR